MSGAFTPGPWTVDDGDVGLWGVFEEADGSEIAYLVTLDGLNQPLKPEESAANARLIAAAPELYEALERINDTPGFALDIDWIRRISRAALAKARAAQ